MQQQQSREVLSLRVARDARCWEPAMPVGVASALTALEHAWNTAPAAAALDHLRAARVTLEPGTRRALCDCTLRWLTTDADVETDAVTHTRRIKQEARARVLRDTESLFQTYHAASAAAAERGAAARPP